MKNPLLAITLHRPWGFAIAHLTKRVENRTWECRLPIGSYLAIHNGKAWNPDGAKLCTQLNPYPIPNPTPETDPPQAIIAIARFGGNVTSDSSFWFQGPIGWVLYEVTPIAPVPCPGRQGFWVPSDEVLAQVRQNYAEAAGIHYGPWP
jgi:hypothetical protein